MNENAIIIGCTATGKVTHARVTPSRHSLRVDYGYVSLGFFVTYRSEILRFDENPELKAIWDGQCWNLAELVDFAANLECYEYQEESQS